MCDKHKQPQDRQGAEMLCKVDKIFSLLKQVCVTSISNHKTDKVQRCYVK